MMKSIKIDSVNVHREKNWLIFDQKQNKKIKNEIKGSSKIHQFNQKYVNFN